MSLLDLAAWGALLGLLAFVGVAVAVVLQAIAEGLELGIPEDEPAAVDREDRP